MTNNKNSERFNCALLSFSSLNRNTYILELTHSQRCNDKW